MKDFINYAKYFIESGINTSFNILDEQICQDEVTELVNPTQSKKPPITELDMPNNNKVSADLNLHDTRSLADKATTLAELEQIVQAFDGCALKKTAKKTVFADGSPQAKIMFIGEAPGASEDAQGIPFCGQSGKLLDNIVKSVGLNRSDIYITNTVFWRPPANRRPTVEEIKICRPFVEKHIQLINPKIIVLVGSTAVESLLASQISMHELRNSFYDYKNQYLEHSIKTAVIFHPSYLLRQLSKKKLMWYDIYRLKQNL